MKKILIVVSIALVFFIVIMVCILNSVDFLCMIAEGSNEPSSLHNFAIERIYKIAEKKEIGEKLIKNIKKNKKENLHTLYIRILGVIGEEATLPCLMEIYIKHQEETKSIKVYNVIKSLGLLGKEEVVPFLERILNREEKTRQPKEKKANKFKLHSIKALSLKAKQWQCHQLLLC